MKATPILLASSLAIAATLSATAAAKAQSQPTLSRAAFLGVQLQPAPDNQGVLVGNVIRGGTAEQVGIKAGDILTAVDGKPVVAPADVVAVIRGLREGNPVRLAVTRAGVQTEIAGTVRGKPLERYSGANVNYGAVRYGDSVLRDILVMPEANPKAPVVFYIQGYSCASIEAGPGEDLFRRFGEELIQRGIGYYRVEKFGMGDSRGLKCEDVDFQTELSGFRAAYHHLIKQRGIAADRIFMMGHSMGGLQAPFLAAEIAPRGVAIYGAVVRNWADYYQDVASTQSFLIAGQDPVAVSETGEAGRPIIDDFYRKKMAPQAIVAARPGSEQFVRGILSWDGGNNVFGRSYKFAQDLPGLKLIEAWKASRTNVLSMYGESDMVALTDIDHRYVADMANYWRAGTGTYAAIPETDHPMNLVGSRAEVRAHFQSGQPPKPARFSVAVIDVLAGWIKQAMAKPPVA